MPVTPIRTPNQAPSHVQALGNLVGYHSSGRSLEELKESNDILSGGESQRLRSYCTSQVMDPNDDLDPFGKLAFWGRTESVKADIEVRLRNYESLPREAQLERVAQEISNLRYGPNRTPIMNCILQARFLVPERRQEQLETARYILDTFAPVASKVDIVDTPDLAGTTALSHAISTKPTFDPEFAQVLWEAGANINKRNRYGATPAHEFCMIWKPQDRAIVNLARQALEWFLSHGGNPDIADGDGMKPSSMILRISVIERGMQTILNDHQAKRKQREKEPKGACLACGEENKKLMQCSRCQTARYCSPPRKCQVADWPCHKKACGDKHSQASSSKGKSTSAGAGGKSSQKSQQPQGFNYLGMQLS
ncbi:hypothetical protein V5O48_008083 [Marasmius crinis-equi]|uniref:MYND-type domain-containing protein n=1 Tax=Marasmius crinis-equi TaxID=585013 RepID=A0ABR3FEV3_9AGAR